MKKWNILLLGLGYIAGLVVATKFAKSNNSKSLEEIGEDLKAIHKNLWTEAETKLFTEENRDRVAHIKAKAIKEIKLFKKDGDAYVKELMKKGDLKKDEIITKLQELYADRETHFETLLSEWKAIIEEALEWGDDAGKKLKKKVESVTKDLKKEFTTSLTQIKKKIK